MGSKLQSKAFEAQKRNLLVMKSVLVGVEIFVNFFAFTLDLIYSDLFRFFGIFYDFTLDFNNEFTSTRRTVNFSDFISEFIINFQFPFNTPIIRLFSVFKSMFYFWLTQTNAFDSSNFQVPTKTHCCCSTCVRAT
jgi:hypothetical protein